MSVEMKRYLIAVITCTVISTISSCDVVRLTFPSGFRIGTASSSYQVEGAWNASDKGENVYDWWTHNYPENIEDRSNGDIACNSYYKYEEDVQWIKSIGLDFYRFSISWSRVLPTGFTNKISEEGLQYYKNLTAELVANGIEPIVTIYHWDHPKIMEDMGGWTNELMVDWFVAYAEVLFDALGGSVKRWITINEPSSFCFHGYEDTALAPGKVITGIGKYLCGHNVLKAHAKTYHLYDEKYRAIQGGQVGLVLALQAYMPANSSDTASVDTAFQFTSGWLAHPIYHGDYPEIMKTRIARRSTAQGYPRSRLPEFSAEWISVIKGTNDYFGFNHYTAYLVSPDPDEDSVTYNTDEGFITDYDPSWPTTAAGWHVVPQGFSYLLRQIKDEYNNPPVWVMENGCADHGELQDYDRIDYFYQYLRELLIAIKLDGCNVEGYSIWSILDNFEWSSGYTQKFGIVSVDFDDPDRSRHAKLSTYWWKNVLASRKLMFAPKKINARTKLPWDRITLNVGE